MSAEDVESSLKRLNYIDPNHNTLAQACQGASIVIEAAPGVWTCGKSSRK